jgi:hypothetical protein
MRNLRLYRRMDSTKISLVWNCNKWKQIRENDLMSAHHCILFSIIFQASTNQYKLKLEFRKRCVRTIIQKFLFQKKIYRSSPKTINLMGRPTNHGENLNTNPNLIFSYLNRTRNLHLQRRKTSATKSLVSKYSKWKQRNE